MDYHSDRFTDHSLIISDDDNCTIALFPANENDDNIYSHQGLTFGGLLFNNRVHTAQVIEILNEVVNYFHNLGFIYLYYKSIPWIYHLIPAEEDIYALSLLKSETWKCEVSSTITSKEQLRYTKGKRWSVHRAHKIGVSVSFTEDFADFWELLISVLWERHEQKPVHSLAEISMLADRFPGSIKLIIACHDQIVVAGAVLFVTEKVVHFQYMATSDKGKECGALDAIIDFVISTYIAKRIIDFGISTENEGQVINKGLIAQKEGFGSGAVVYRSYRVHL